MKLGYPWSLLILGGLFGACSEEDSNTNGGGGNTTSTTSTTFTTTTTTGSTTSSSGSGCGGYEFPGTEGCVGCLETSCCSELGACEAASECAAFVDCAEACATDTSCVEGCASSHAEGVDAAQALYECLAESCSDECADGICGTELLYPDNESLTQCTTDHCCSSYLPCYENEECNGCLQDPDAEGCDTDPLYVPFGSCMDAHCPTRICESSLAYPSWVMNLCINESCCEPYDPCFADAACNGCVQDPESEGCDANELFTAYLGCKTSHCPTTICTTNIGYSVGDDPTIDCNLCAAASCCADLDTCDGDGSDAATNLCVACLNDPDATACNDTTVHDAAVDFTACLATSCADECL